LFVVRDSSIIGRRPFGDSKGTLRACGERELEGKKGYRESRSGLPPCRVFDQCCDAGDG
jgi:hypothetical protein